MTAVSGTEINGRKSTVPIRAWGRWCRPISNGSRPLSAFPFRTRQLQARLAAGGFWQDRGFVFTSSVGTPLEPRNVTRQFKALLTAANLPDMRLHDLRHSCATLLLAQSVNPRVVMETLGNSQVSLTLNTYSHVLPAVQQDAAARMNALLEG